ncbi:hypothetical protein [Reichenbachiella sp. 5M10]|uniref:hypothetical protein n=1 Tax=Reichenbachiella sp. 5M10 TaxID=1889772 RepID=UPI0011799CF2|nr:hypothetical protein [Reichenbachiella sp. 5M10]
MLYQTHVASSCQEILHDDQQAFFQSKQSQQPIHYRGLDVGFVGFDRVSGGSLWDYFFGLPIKQYNHEGTIQNIYEEKHGLFYSHRYGKGGQGGLLQKENNQEEEQQEVLLGLYSLG